MGGGGGNYGLGGLGGLGGGGLDSSMISQLLGLPVGEGESYDLGKVIPGMAGGTGLDGGATLAALQGLGFGSSKESHVDEITVDDFFDAIIEALDNDKDVFEYNKEINSDSWFGKQSFGGLVDGFNFIDPKKFINRIYGSPFGLANAQAMFGMQYGIPMNKFKKHTGFHQIMTGYSNPYGPGPQPSSYDPPSPYGQQPSSYHPPTPPPYTPPVYPGPIPEPHPVHGAEPVPKSENYLPGYDGFRGPRNVNYLPGYDLSYPDPSNQQHPEPYPQSNPEPEHYQPVYQPYPQENPEQQPSNTHPYPPQPEQVPHQPESAHYQPHQEPAPVSYPSYPEPSHDPYYHPQPQADQYYPAQPQADQYYPAQTQPDPYYPAQPLPDPYYPAQPQPDPYYPPQPSYPQQDPYYPPHQPQQHYPEQVPYPPQNQYGYNPNPVPGYGQAPTHGGPPRHPAAAHAPPATPPATPPAAQAVNPAVNDPTV